MVLNEVIFGSFFDLNFVQRYSIMVNYTNIFSDFL